MRHNTSPVVIPEHLVSPIHINGMTGRKVTVPPNDSAHSERDFVFFYGHHGSLERVYAFAEYLADFGSVTIYDIPGFGGMDSFYSIGRKPTLDMYADYLHAIFKTHKRTSSTTVVGMSLTFTMLTRMFQKYPETTSYFDQVVSFVGFAHYSNFKFFPRYISFVRNLSRLFATKLIAWLTRILVFNPLSLSLLMGFFLRYNPKLSSVSRQDKRDTIQMEKDLWRRNDMRTHFATYLLMFSLKYPESKTIDLHVYNMTTETDQYFHEGSVESSLRALYTSVSTSFLNLDVHTPSLVATKQDVANIVPDEVRKEVLDRE